MLCMTIVDMRVVLSVVSLDMVLLAWLPEDDCECPSLILGDSAKAQPTQVVIAYMQY